MREHVVRFVAGAFAVAGGVMLMAGPAAAHECTNASRDLHAPTAGVKIVIDTTTEEGAVEWASPGVVARFEHGVIDQSFHGIVGLDFNGDQTVDAYTFLLTPNGELPTQAQFNGSPDHGIVNLCGTGCE